MLFSKLEEITLSVRSVPPFDMLSGQKSPYLGFGEPRIEPLIETQRFFESVALARLKLKKAFPGNFDDAEALPDCVDKIISEMWKTGWDPKSNNLNLFITDFGAVVTDAVLKLYSGSLVFRSDIDVSHLSVWWPNLGVELFVFHSVSKALSQPEGATIKSLFKGLNFHVHKN